MDNKINDVEEVFAAGATGVNVLVDEEHVARDVTCKMSYMQYGFMVQQ